MTEHSVVGDLINFRGLVYAPINEAGVVFLFGKVAADLNMYVEEIKPGFPDCIARRFTGKGWERVAIEFEFESANFKQHRHDPRACDLIVCWRHNWPDCPIEVIALADRIKELENPPVERPGLGAGTQAESTLEDLIKRKGANGHVETLMRRLLEEVERLDERVFCKVGQGSLSCYSPERVFCYVYFRKNGLRIELFTRGERIEGVKPFQSDSMGTKWGILAILDMEAITKATPVLAESLKRIRAAVKENESTSWQSAAASGEGEPDGEGHDAEAPG